MVTLMQIAGVPGGRLWGEHKHSCRSLSETKENERSASMYQLWEENKRLKVVTKTMIPEGERKIWTRAQRRPLAQEDREYL